MCIDINGSDRNCIGASHVSGISPPPNSTASRPDSKRGFHFRYRCTSFVCHGNETLGRVPDSLTPPDIVSMGDPTGQA
jgi:hypothetical protein